VARARRDLLLRAHRHLLRWEDLEDCYSQATLELLAHVRRGGRFADRRHLANTLELRFVSRIRDARRAAAGRSPITAALVAAASLGGAGEDAVAVFDARPPVEQTVIMRHDLRRVGDLARRLTPDQRLALASQLATDTPCAEFCRRHGWTEEKYRKVLQRARARLRVLAADDDAPCPEAAKGSEMAAGVAHEDRSPHS
jgi:DNA-directed RNA polymerase specialized sigma24 family protein